MEKFLSHLIKFKTITADLTANEKAIGWLKSSLRGLPLYIKELNFGGHPSLIITTQKTKSPKIFLAAHLDVVPASASLFQPLIKNNKLSGRGAFDMKYAIACYWRLLKEFGKELHQYDLGVMITSDEEIGGFNGTQKLLALGYKADVCFLPDSGKNWVLENEAKGVWHLLVEAQGKSAHGSVPWQGVNAIEQLIDYLNIARDQFFCPSCKYPNHYHETLNIGKIQGGQATNKVPDYASASIDIRFTPRLSKKVIWQKLQAAKKGFKNIKIKEIIFADSYKLDANNKFVKLYTKLAKDKYKIKIPVQFSHGSTDARFFMAKGIPTLVISPQGGGAHSEKEWLDLKDLERFYQILKEFVTQLAKNKY